MPSEREEPAKSEEVTSRPVACSAVTGHMVAIRKLIEQFGLDDRDVQACARNAEILIRHDREVIA